MLENSYFLFISQYLYTGISYFTQKPTQFHPCYCNLLSMPTSLTKAWSWVMASLVGAQISHMV